ncbi:MAG TPA: cytochrome o ubiquinol oxidase subunit IV [Candidatus Saccharimonadia bacterium]
MTRGRYMLGFVVSVGLTLLAGWLVSQHLATHHAWPPDSLLPVWLVGIALGQLLAQLILFLHVGEESKPRWKLMVMLFAALVVLVVVVGSIWIMNNLNYHMMDDPAGLNAAIMHDEGIHR